MFLFFSAKRAGSQKFVVCTESSYREESDDSGSTIAFLEAFAGSAPWLKHWNEYLLAHRFFSVVHPGGTLVSLEVRHLESTVRKSKSMWQRVLASAKLIFINVHNPQELTRT